MVVVNPDASVVVETVGFVVAVVGSLVPPPVPVVLPGDGASVDGAFVDEGPGPGAFVVWGG